MRFILALLALVAFSGQVLAADAVAERVRKNQEINCGVYVLGTIFSYDREGKPSGFTTDLMNEIGERTGKKIKYTEISSFATLFEDLNVGHYDMLCAPLLVLPASLMKGMPGRFIMEDPINIYADATADLTGITSFEQLNDQKYTFVGMDGELGAIYAPKLFPKAKLNLLPMGATPSNMMMEVHTKKANFLILSRLAYNAYEKANPGKLKQVTDKSLLDTSVRLFFPDGATTLKSNIDVVIEDMTRDGTLEKLLKQHGLKE